MKQKTVHSLSIFYMAMSIICSPKTWSTPSLPLMSPLALCRSLSQPEAAFQLELFIHSIQISKDLRWVGLETQDHQFILGTLVEFDTSPRGDRHSFSMTPYMILSRAQPLQTMPRLITGSIAAPIKYDLSAKTQFKISSLVSNPMGRQNKSWMLEIDTDGNWTLFEVSFAERRQIISLQKNLIETRNKLSTFYVQIKEFNNTQRVELHSSLIDLSSGSILISVQNW